MVLHGRIMTNTERVRRHVASSDLCPLCKKDPETILHVLRDCPKAKQIWGSILGQTMLLNFNNLSLYDWLEGNIKEELYDTLIVGWNERFMSTIWWIWKWRNSFIFRENEINLQSKLDFLRSVWSDTEEAFRTVSPITTLPKRNRIMMVGWKPPPQGTWKLNTDGAKENSYGLAACGGLIRSCHGILVKGFTCKIGRCTAFAAEVWGVFHGLQLAWNLGLRHVQVEVDSKDVIKALQSNEEVTDDARNVIYACKNLIQKEWNVTLLHVFREGNTAADHLARLGLSSYQPLGTQILEEPLIGLQNILWNDCKGHCVPRVV